MGSGGMRISMLLAIKHTPSYTHADLPVRIVVCIRSTIAHTLLLSFVARSRGYRSVSKQKQEKPERSRRLLFSTHNPPKKKWIVVPKLLASLAVLPRPWKETKIKIKSNSWLTTFFFEKWFVTLHVGSCLKRRISNNNSGVFTQPGAFFLAPHPVLFNEIKL
jgi:hypothetical protein